MKKKMIKPLLTIACLLSSISVSAYDFEVDGIYYDVVSLSEKTCKVVKKYDSYKYEGDIVIPATLNYANKTLTVVDIEDKLFYECKDLTGITIPNTISSIGDEMFNGCDKLKRVKIEDGETVLKLGVSSHWGGGGLGLFRISPLKSLYIGRDLSYSTQESDGYSPFYGNDKIKDVTIGNSVTSIGDYAFKGCSGLTSVTIPNSVTSIGDYAFENCRGLTSVTIGNSVTSIGYCVFYGCSGLTSVTIPNSVTSIGNNVFSYCSGLTSVTIPNSVTSIGDNAFEWCSGLTSVTIPNSVTSIGDYAFERCSGLTSVTIPNSVTSIGDYAFERCSGLTSVTIPNSVISIGNNVFSYCSGLTSVTIPNSVTSIGDYAFFMCSGLTSVTVPNSVTSIGYSAFNGCGGLSSVVLGNSVEKISNKVFEGCYSLTSLYSLNTTPPGIGDYNFTNNQYMTTNVYVPEEALEAYQNAERWKDFWNLQGFESTGMKDVEVNGVNRNGKYYDLRGNKLDAPKRGINIINGKKVVVK